MTDRSVIVSPSHNEKESVVIEGNIGGNSEGEHTAPRVLVIGATGYLGSHIVTHLRQAGYPVRALARDPQRLEEERERGIEVFTGQVTRPETLDGLCDGVSVVVSTLGVRSLARRPTPWEVDYQGNLNVLTLARQAGVRQFIFVGVLHGAEARSHIPILEPRERFIDTLQHSELAWTIIRPTGAFNDMKAIFQQARRGRVWLLGTGSARINPIHPADLAAEVARCIEDASARNTTYDLGGPDILSYDEIARLAFAVLGSKSRISHLPPWIVNAASLALKPFNPTGAGFLRFFRWVTTNDMVGAPCGHIHLRDFFAQLASQGRRDER
jgi:uncharacterized protein YbjT (DUF2867 family)